MALFSTLFCAAVKVVKKQLLKTDWMSKEDAKAALSMIDLDCFLEHLNLRY
jgi:hypothetical protein